MAELELVGIHADGEHIVLVDEEGQRHRLPIDDALRAAVRRDRPQLEQIRTDGLRPRQIQTMIRAGASAEDVAAEAGMPVEQVRRYEGPALAERVHVAQRAQALSIGREPGSPTLGDLVVDRLAARGASGIRWDARRQGSEPWEVIARFVAGERDREATWRVDLSAGTVAAIDDESRWLSETDLSSGSPRRHLTAVRGARLYDVETDADLAPTLAAVDAVIRDTRPRDEREAAELGSVAEPDEADEADEASQEHGSEPDTEAILDELSAARGVRQRVEIDDEALAEEVANDPTREASPPPQESAEPHTPTLWDDEPPGAHPAASRPQEAEDATVLEPRSARKTSRSAKSRRTSVPSWDEIVFGAKSD